jgi:TPR repeat protein
MRYRLAASILLVYTVSAPLLGQNATLGLNAAKLFDKGMNGLMGYGVARNDLTALDYFRRSAELGYAPAQVVLGYFYDTGTIVNAEPAQALAWYKKAAEQDDRLAEWLVGRLIYTGGTGAPRDLNEAIQWLEKAAAHDDPFAEYLLGSIFLERGQYLQAAGLFRKAAVQGLPQAQEQLGLLLKKGLGVAEDKFEAYVWLLLSFEAGNQAVAADLQALEADLGSNSIEQAKNKVRDLEGTVTRAVAAHGCTGWAGEFQTIPTPPPPDIQRFCR